MMDLVTVSMGKHENAGSPTFSEGSISSGCFACLPEPAPVALGDFAEKTGSDHFIAGSGCTIAFMPFPHGNIIAWEDSGDNMDCDTDDPHVVLKETEA